MAEQQQRTAATRHDRYHPEFRLGCFECAERIQAEVERLRADRDRLARIADNLINERERWRLSAI